VKILGLTGGIGMGKSAAGELLRAQGCEVIDTDDIARDLVKPGTRGLKEIEAAFGSKYISEFGELRRNALAELVFSDLNARCKLEAILHPHVRSAWLRKVSQWRSERTAVGVVIIPLLFETGAQTEFDATISVVCGRRTQNARLSERGWNGIEIERRIASQLSSDEKAARADFVVWSEGTLLTHQKQLEIILEKAA
jgi:dephospho-CoA kinase